VKQTTIIFNEADKEAFIAKIKAAVITKPVQVETSLYKPKRSLAINKLMWLWNGEIQKHLKESQGQIYSTEDIHEYFVDLLLPRKMVNINGREKAIRAHTSKMTNKEMCDYLEILEMYCSEHLGLILPHPEEMYNEAMDK